MIPREFGREFLWVLLLALAVGNADAAERFGRRVLAPVRATELQVSRMDEIDVPAIDRDSVVVSCITYRGTGRYFVEVTVLNRTEYFIALADDLIQMTRPGYTILRPNTTEAAIDAAEEAEVEFEPVPPPDMGTESTIDATSQQTGTGAPTGHRHGAHRPEFITNTCRSGKCAGQRVRGEAIQEETGQREGVCILSCKLRARGSGLPRSGPANRGRSSRHLSRSSSARRRSG